MSNRRTVTTGLRFTKRSAGGWFVHYGNRRIGFTCRAGGRWHAWALLSTGKGQTLDGTFGSRREASERIVKKRREEQVW